MEMNLKKLAWTGLMAAVCAAWASPVSWARDRDDRDGFKKDVLRAVEKLMDRKLKEFKTDLMKDMKKMLQGQESRRGVARVQERVARVPQAQKKHKVQTQHRVSVLEGPPGHKREGKKTQRNVSVLNKSGKVQIRVEVDGKVMEKEFDLDDPELRKWMGKLTPGGFRFEGPGAKGGFRVEVEKGRHGEKSERPRGKGRSQLRVMRTPGKGMPGMGDAGKWLELLKERFGDRWKQWDRDGKPPWIEIEKDFFVPGQKNWMKKVKPQKAVKVYRAHKPRSGSDLEKLRKEKDELKRELGELRELLEKLLGRMKRR